PGVLPDRPPFPTRRSSDLGEMRGMRGGLVIVRGNAGARVGDRMRRGIILVEGDLGDHAGARLLAGTVIGLGSSGAYPGLGMKRGDRKSTRLNSSHEWISYA